MQRDDPLDGRPEAHVEHAVDLVEDEHRDVVEPHQAAREEVLEPAGRGDDDVAARSRPALADDADAADDGGDADAGARRPMAWISLATWAASSRVGVRTSAAAPRPSVAIRSTSGMPKARVLPEPVGDCATTSRPASASRRTRSWIGKGSVMPRATRASATDCDTPRA